MKHIVSRMSSYFPNRWPLNYLNLTKNMKTYIRRQRHKKFKHQDIKQKEPLQKYRLGTISNTKLLAGLNRFSLKVAQVPPPPPPSIKKMILSQQKTIDQSVSCLHYPKFMKGSFVTNLVFILRKISLSFLQRLDHLSAAKPHYLDLWKTGSEPWMEIFMSEQS